MTVSISGKKILLILIVIFLLAGSLFAKSVTGTITYIEGYVDLYRDGELLDLFRLEVFQFRTKIFFQFPHLTVTPIFFADIET